MRLVDTVVRRAVPRSWYDYFGFIRRDPSRKDHIPLGKKIAMWRKGFYANRYYYYNLKENSSGLYLSDYFNLLTHPKNGRYSSLIDNKLYVPIYLKDFQEHLVQYYFLLMSETVMELQGERRVFSKRDSDYLDVIFDLISSQKCIGKPAASSCGTGVLVFERRPTGFFLNNKAHGREALESMFKSLHSYMITEFVQQHSYSASLNETTTNTVRLLTCWDVDTNVPFVARAFHRIGRPGMYGADNGALGGLITLIDVDSGTLGHIALIQDRHVQYVQTHPDTGRQVCGVEIPHFKRIVSTVLDMCRTLNFIPYIAWDIVVTEHSFRVLELNSNTDLYGYQLFEPLLSDTRLLNFYRTFVTNRTRRYFMK